uniref:Uncharacterized protein n=1 Tax=Fagus sylvatica TaxID=28930 RepID=A0A2N9J1Y9_FAGSY
MRPRLLLRPLSCLQLRLSWSPPFVGSVCSLWIQLPPLVSLFPTPRGCRLCAVFCSWC